MPKDNRNKRMYTEEQREAHAERWTRETRNWKLPDIVALNPTEEIKEIAKKQDSLA
ncbi:MAG TPA: hypothetical protein PK733_04960 [Clostridiales bacterium]|nr:hypothetical protein [Clostridiales bacterium]